MTANYLVSDTQREVLAQIEGADRAAKDFFVEAPLVIDCQSDAAGFDARVSTSRQETIRKRFSSGGLRVVSGLLRPARDYAIEQAVQRFRQLDRNAAAQVREFLADWRRNTDAIGAGLDIVLPGSIRLSFDLSDLMAVNSQAGTPA